MTIQERLDKSVKKTRNIADIAERLSSNWEKLNALTRIQNSVSARNNEDDFLSEDVDAFVYGADLKGDPVHHKLTMINAGNASEISLMAVHYESKMSNRTMTESEYNTIRDGSVEEITEIYSRRKP